MAFSTASSLLRHKLAFSAASRRALYGLSAARFLSATPLRSKRLAKPKRRDESDTAAIEANTSEKILPTELHTEATEAYMSYAMSVLLGRALPDVRDGLKPVHRRILFAMHELGLSSRRPHKKCARVVGEVLGKYHPHGDTAVYDSLVRMAQEFSLRWPLIRGHGNFGSIDADPPAAMRYTECRLSPLTEAMLLADLDHDTVEFVPNFDNSQKEPAVLPARLPNLLLNGASGIAVGMATNIPPHNLGELVDALSLLIHNPEATLQELLEALPGPDFPTGGLIIGNAGIRDAYSTGRGSVVVRGKTEVEELPSPAKRSAIIVHEVPYQTNKAALVEKIADLVENKSLEGVSDIRDESDRGGMRVVIELKRGTDPAVVLNNLYRQTSLQSTFSCNMVGILDGQPKVMGLKELLQAFLEFRCTVIERRARFKLGQAQDRKHVVEGIMVGLRNVDDVIRIIKESSSNAVASESLRSQYGLSEKQSDALLDMTLRKLTLGEMKKFVDEDEALEEQISDLTDLLSSKQKMLYLIEEEAIEVKSKFSTPRRSMLEEGDRVRIDDIDVIPNEDMLLILSEKGYLERMKPSAFSLQHRGTIGKSVGKMRVNDAMSDFLVGRTHDHVLFFTDKGLVYSCRAYKIPECSKTAAGTPVVQILSLSDGERVTSVILINEFSEDRFLVMLTVSGYIKKVPLKLFSSIRQSGIIAIQLIPNDELKWVKLCSNDDLVAMASQNGWALVSSCEAVGSLGRVTRGSAAMRLKDGDKVACMDVIPAAVRSDLEKRSKSLNAPWLLFVSEGGFGKRVPLTNFTISRLNRGGLVGYKLQPEDRLVGIFFVGYTLDEDGESDEQLVLVSQTGTVNRIKVRDISIQSRFAKGVILMRLEYAGRIQTASVISAAGEELDAKIVE